MLSPQPTVAFLRDANDRTALRTIVAMAGANGCTCTPEIHLPPRRDRRRGVVRDVAVLHDDWCPLLQWTEAQAAGNGRLPEASGGTSTISRTSGRYNERRR